MGLLRSSAIPEWLQECKKIWWMMKFPNQGDSHASSSHEASLEPTFKRREDSGKHIVILISLKTEIADLSEDYNYKGTVQKTQWRSSTSCRQVRWLDNSRMTKSSTRMVNHGTITGTLSLFRILPLNGFNPVRAKQRLLKRRTRVYESSSSRRKNQKLLFRTPHWNLEKSCGRSSMESPHFSTSSVWDKMASLREPFDE